MKIKYIAHLFLITLASAIAAGCASAPSRLYTLSSMATEDGAPAMHCAIIVDPVSVPALVDQPQLTIQIASNRVEQEEFDRWAEPLNDNIARIVAGNLAVLLGTSQVVTVPLANFNPDYRVTIDIQRFESIQGKSALIQAVWVVRKSGGGMAHSGCTLASETVSDNSLDALAAAHSRLLAKVSSDIAAAIRAEAWKK